jgi:hypothetical protein
MLDRFIHQVEQLADVLVVIDHRVVVRGLVVAASGIGVPASENPT